MNSHSHTQLAPAHVGRQVLIVEDEKRLRDTLVTAINEMLFYATPVATAEAGLRLLEQKPFDIVLLDLNLPGISGMELLSIIHRRWPEAQAIILTGYGDLEAARQAIRLDVVDFLTKPTPLQDLELALHRARDKRLANWRPPALPPDPDTQAHAARPRSAPRTLVHLPVTQPPASEGTVRSLDDMERESILAALQRHNGNRADAAAALGISVRKLYYRLVEYQKQGYLP